MTPEEELGWLPIVAAPRAPRDEGHSFGPLVWVLLPYSTYEADIGWWCAHDGCFRYTGDDGPHDIQPTHFKPLDVPAVP